MTSRRRRGPRYWTVRLLLRGARLLRTAAARLDPPPRVRDRALASQDAAVLRGPWPPPEAPMDDLAAQALSRAVHPSSVYGSDQLLAAMYADPAHPLRVAADRVRAGWPPPPRGHGASYGDPAL